MMINFVKTLAALGFVLLGCATACLGSTTYLDFTSGGVMGGTVTFSGSTLQTFSGVPVNELVVGPNTYTITNSSLTYTPVLGLTPASLQLTGDISGLAGLSSGTNVLETITLTAPPVAVSTPAAGYSITSLSLGSVSTNSTLLSDLGLQPTTSLFSFSDSGTCTTCTVPSTYDSTSLNMIIAASPQNVAPEPVSMLLVSGGLIGFGAFRWRKARSSR
jgi:hypothetical protein